ncbi:MAG: NUDIX domain-containing protein [Salinivirgaceae bacterium]
MSDMYKIYFNEFTIVITSPKKKEEYKNSGFCELTTVNELLNDNFFDTLAGNTHKKWCIGALSPDETFDKLKQHFLYIEAAGGLVISPNKTFVAIIRKGKYDLPKGKCEPGETIEESAIREVEEECGLHNLSIKTALPSTYHIYELKNKLVLKKTYWFLMHTTEQPLTPQVEEDITEATWMSLREIDQFLTNTYPTLTDLLSVTLKL